jgi:hypothetical protein
MLPDHLEVFDETEYHDETRADQSEKKEHLENGCKNRHDRVHDSELYLCGCEAA